jgi:small subunit ribosomal protein S9
MADDETPNEQPEETPAEQPAAEEPQADAPQPDADEARGEAEVLPSDDTPGREIAFDAEVTEDGLIEAVDAAEDVEEIVEGEPEPRVKPAIPGMDLEVDLVGEGQDPLGRGSQYSEDVDPDAEPVATSEDEEEVDDQPIAATIDMAADARYRATGKRKTAVARVTIKPGTGQYTINGRTLDEFFPRETLQRTIRQPLETVGYETRMDVVARMHGGGVAAQAGALRHGISRALLEADPTLRGELKRRGFLTRDARVKERKKAGLKKARKRPQFSKR